MKAIEIKDVLKKELMIIETSEQIILTTTATGYMLRDNSTNEETFIEGYTLLGKPNEISEEDAREVVHEVDGYNPVLKEFHKAYRLYNGRIIRAARTATESLLSAIGSEIYWENPFGEKPIWNAHELQCTGYFSYMQGLKRWKEAKSRTFDLNRTIIFVKN